MKNKSSTYYQQKISIIIKTNCYFNFDQQKNQQLLTSDKMSSNLIITFILWNELNKSSSCIHRDNK